MDNNDINSLEDMMNTLEECIQRMESGEMSLQESFDTFKSGMELVKKCNDNIDKVEKEVVKLMDDGTIEPLEERF